MVAETGVHAVEVNLSCPNIGGHGLLCHDPETARRVVRAVREAIGPLPLFAKIGDFPPDERGDPALNLHRATLDAASELKWLCYYSTVGVYGDFGGAW